MTRRAQGTGGSSAWAAANWASMPLAVLAALALIDWEGSGQARPFVMFLAPALLGAAGCFAGVRAGKPGRAAVALLVGVAAVPALMALVLVLYGP